MGTLITILLTVVYLERSDSLTFNSQRIPDAQILVGNVCFRHDSMYMYCDSAYFYDRSNSLLAMGHVHLVQGDTLEGFGERMYYNGDSKLGRFRRNVKLIHNGMTLTTDSLNYDRRRSLAWYYSGGMIQDSVNTLTSIRGEYHTNNSQAVFQHDVHLVNKDFVLDTDTLHYNTESHMARIVCPTEIVSSDTSVIHCHLGRYYTQTDYMILHEDADFTSPDEELPTYLYADTMHVWYRGDSIIASRHIRAYREDIQFVCDSFRHVARDSMSYLYGKPILWNSLNQMSADSMHIYMKDSEIDRAHGMGNGLSVQQAEFDSTLFNQVCGKELWAQFVEREVTNVEFSGNAETIFYPDDNGEYIGLNNTQSSYVKVFLENRYIHHIRLTSETTGVMYPMDQIPSGKNELPTFFWAADVRPIDPDDVRRIAVVQEHKVIPLVSAAAEEPYETKDNNEEKTTDNRNRKSKKK